MRDVDDDDLGWITTETLLENMRLTMEAKRFYEQGDETTRLWKTGENRNLFFQLIHGRSTRKTYGKTNNLEIVLVEEDMMEFDVFTTDENIIYVIICLGTAIFVTIIALIVYCCCCRSPTEVDKDRPHNTIETQTSDNEVNIFRKKKTKET